ncbi:MAG: S1 RNA-binding domain-containing protein [Clostridia bacterium]|nr:S1 RNA-binding domain-containing protein [Clostridia bacterium]
MEKKETKSKKTHQKGKVQKGNIKLSKAKVFSLKELEAAKASGQVFEAMIKEVDDTFNLHGYFINGVPCIVPREEVSSLVGEDGLVEEKHCSNKVGKIMQVCIKDIVTIDGKIDKVILSKKMVELKVRHWMYIHLKDGMKLKGVVRGMTDYAAFIDVGGGVTGMLKIEDVCNVRLNKISDKLRLGQRILVVVKNYDRDTGKIELSTKELQGTFKDNIKNLKEGEMVEGVVRNREKNGIFIELENNLIGLADHVSGVEYGQKVLVHVKRINEEKSKIKLKIVG